MFTPNLVHALDDYHLRTTGIIHPIKGNTNVTKAPNSYLPAPEPEDNAPLLPYEEAALQYLLNQVNAAPTRVRLAMLSHPKLMVS